MSELNEETSPHQFNCNRRVRNFIEVLDLLDKSLPQTSQQRVNKIIQLEGSDEFLSNDQTPAKATKSEPTVIRVPDQRLRSTIGIQDPQNTHHSQSTMSSPLNTTRSVTEKTTPKLEHNLINPPKGQNSSK